MLYDDGVVIPGGDPTPFGKDEIFAAAREMYHAMGDETAKFIDMMLENDAFDVDSRKNKWGGGYCTEFPKFKQPFILANFNGTAGDVDVVTHEAGHAFNAYLIADNRFALELGCGFVFIAEAGHGEYGAVITNALLKDFKVTADELFDMAIKNTAEQFPAVLQDLAESATRYPTGCVNLLDSKCGRAPADTGPAYVLTNSRFFWGAGALFYPGVIDRLRELLDGDFYVLPSSVHELILIAADDQDPKQLADLVRSANRSVVEERDILADDLYICEAGIMKRVSYGGMVPGGMPC